MADNADNTDKNLTYFLNEAAGSAIDFATSTIAAVQTFTEKMVDAINVTMFVEVEDSRDVMKFEEENVADVVNFVMSAIIGPIVCIFGLVGNLISIITWSRAGMRGSTGRYLTGQAIANFAVLLMFLLSDSILYWTPRVKYSIVYGVFFSYIAYPIFHYAFICCIWITVGVTIDRYIMVCWITKAKKLCSEFRATVSIVLIAVIGFIINIPRFTIFIPVFPDHISSKTNHNVNVIQIKEAFVLTEFGASNAGQHYESAIHYMVLVMIPWVSVFIMNVLIIAKINKANKRMADKKTAESAKKSRESENQITRLLLAATFVFLFFLGLQCISQCLCQKKPAGINLMTASAFFGFGKTGILFHASMNFILYCLTGRRFRKELLKMMGFGRKGKPLSSFTGNSSSNTTSNITTVSTDTLTKDI